MMKGESKPVALAVEALARYPHSKLEAIKWVRNHPDFHLGLIEAKNAVELAINCGGELAIGEVIYRDPKRSVVEAISSLGATICRIEYNDGLFRPANGDERDLAYANRDLREALAALVAEAGFRPCHRGDGCGHTRCAVFHTAARLLGGGDNEGG